MFPVGLFTRGVNLLAYCDPVNYSNVHKDSIDLKGGNLTSKDTYHLFNSFESTRSFGSSSTLKSLNFDLVLVISCHYPFLNCDRYLSPVYPLWSVAALCPAWEKWFTLYTLVLVRKLLSKYSFMSTYFVSYIQSFCSRWCVSLSVIKICHWKIFKVFL